MKRITYYRKKIMTWLLPYQCILCSNTVTRSQDLCLACLQSLPYTPFACPLCAQPWLNIQDNLICGHCLKQTPPFDRTYALFIYETAVTKLIMDLKFGQALMNARILGELLSEKIVNDWYLQRPLPEIIIPLPLHPKRLRERGYNQALELARPIAKKLHLPLETTACIRTIHTSAQATLPARARATNIKNAFAINGNLPYHHVAVLDDVITTGSTMVEFCKTLRQSGVETIDVWCCARAAL